LTIAIAAKCTMSFNLSAALQHVDRLRQTGPQTADAFRAADAMR
jgi:hypothetical protein